MTKKCNLFFCRVVIFIFSFMILSAHFVVAQTVSGDNKETDAANQQKKWIIASMPFMFSQRRSFSAYEQAITTELPALILSQFSSTLARTPDLQEVTDRTLRDLRKSRQSLFLQLSKEMQTRDSLVLGNYDEKEFEIRAGEAQEKIDVIRKQMDDNLLEAEKVIKRNNDNSNDYSKISEFVDIYQNNADALYSSNITNSEGKPDLHGYAFSEQVISAGVNSLMVGSVTVYGAYISCAVELYVYPGARVIATASEIGRSDNLAMIAQSIAQQLQPQITFEMPVTLRFAVGPFEASGIARLTVDDVVYTTIPESMTVHSGVHSILFTAEGFESVGTSYHFSGNEVFEISVNLKPVMTGNALLRLSIPDSGTFYVNASQTQMYDNPETAVITINGSPVLGQFVTEDGSAALFYVPENLLTNENMLTVQAHIYDRSEVIEKRRKWMYTAYSIFISSLIPTFVTYGSYSSELAAYQSGNGNAQLMQTWQVASWVAIGLTIGAAGFFVFELVRYLLAANSVLPATAQKENFNIDGMILRTNKKNDDAEKNNLKDNSDNDN